MGVMGLDRFSNEDVFLTVAGGVELRLTVAETEGGA